ncbi:MAG: 50S ribosomal protein L19 [Candidatus Sungbacteria bacterium RIFCSPLOWO2_01_FULL_47_10]|uniref:50S ribosomal protein L19 n=1 Tax=Candidatus Sungbacteria bacterium RIFCSPLOWO2_01_FULL_47_10 TaxID=1802276 RepID=A0A1G2L0N7_9BACT|nr:MAG: 50S ribosomal protein L19 [Candidatus Sungbacteria bacterium RIFCSPLOWO2_01_FULL_47_10]
MNKLDTFNQKQLKQLPEIRPGDTVKIFQRLKEGDKARIQPFEGMIIAIKHGRGISGTITIRKVTQGIGVEKVIPIHSPTVEKIQVLKHAKTRRAKLYYIRTKAAREVRRKMKPTEVMKEITVEEAATNTATAEQRI